jgi:hypothetical protein
MVRVITIKGVHYMRPARGARKFIEKYNLAGSLELDQGKDRYKIIGDVETVKDALKQRKETLVPKVKTPSKKRIETPVKKIVKTAKAKNDRKVCNIRRETYISEDGSRKMVITTKCEGGKTAKSKQ